MNELYEFLCDLEDMFFSCDFLNFSDVCWIVEFEMFLWIKCI